ncbi:MAG: beta-aspartyl-peptidase [Pseudoxanthomonas sp.]|jgi:beta-aspartyl-dipeptidase (metallo-type)|uniref:beta-aspartyl-peptidase n=1 Tax=Pseudoxanthomonas TaxID=83618 RepID=UPI001389CF5A|nr:MULTISPECIES: beta-aspartyl-peptidase [Pseudoxanthomonas]KAF1729206.1 beta-aspartyl-peptidase [Pseudoxanthomonas mexicana]MCH2092287.1 beta-aspartyl-peptidase [Pseudoxanthomonas sp.]
MTTTLIRNAEVYAPESLGRRDLLLGGGKVLWIGTDAPDLPAAFGAQVLDLGGRRLLPGLIDGHVHVTGGGGEAGFASRVPAPTLSRYTRGGVTTVVGLLGTDDVARGTRELLAHVNALREEGLSAWGYAGGYHLPPATLTGSVRADLVFIDCLIGVGELAISDHRSSQPTLDELLRIASEAHVAGLMTGKAGIVHLHLGDGSRGLDLVRRALDQSELPPRVFNPTHVNRRKALFEEAIALARRGCSIDITAFPVDEGEDAWSAADALVRYLDSGAPRDRVTVSSDAGGCLPCFDAQGRVCSMDVGHSGALVDTLRELLARGIALQDALPAFTSNVAGLLRLPGKGRIAVGADADLVALDADGTVTDVFAGGRPHLRDGAVLRRGTFESQDT